jgi:hypothetical protein
MACLSLLSTTARFPPDLRRRYQPDGRDRHGYFLAFVDQPPMLLGIGSGIAAFLMMLFVG